MADLIDRKELRDALYEADAVTMQGVKIINQFPAVNAVPVVRCRDCKHYLIVDETFCMRRYMCTVNHFSYLENDGDNHFCSYGERKEGDD